MDHKRRLNRTHILSVQASLPSHHEDDDDDDSMSAMYLDHEERTNPRSKVAPPPLSTGSSCGDTTITSATAENDPARLFNILEECLRLVPRGNETDGLLPPTDAPGRCDLTDNIWDVVRQWLRHHRNLQRAAAFVRGLHNETPLHLMCKIPFPPLDLISTMVKLAPEIVAWTDSQGWLPLHHACSNGFVSHQVVEILIDAYPEGKVKQDSQKRTPLHFHVTKNVSPDMTTITELLGDTGAASLRDKAGMYPIHYACAYGAAPNVLQILTHVYPPSYTALDGKKRTPFHLAMVNSHRTGMPAVMRFLLGHKKSRATINARDQDGFLPVHLLALSLRSAKSYDATKRANVCGCLALYLDAEPFAAADFLAAIQDLPHWLQDRAVVSPHVRNVLNERIVHPLPSAILMMDAYMLVVIIICFAKATEHHIEIRFNGGGDDETRTLVWLLLLGGVYFLFRELVQIFSLIQMPTTRRLRALNAWWLDAQNWLDVAVVLLVFYFGSLMLENDPTRIEPRNFQIGVACTQGFLFLNVIVHLQSTYIDFAVFVGGLLHVVRRLGTFITAVGIILIAFAQMFYFIYTRTFVCPYDGMSLSDQNHTVPEEYIPYPHCSLEKSMIRVYTMMLGEVDGQFIYSWGPDNTKSVAQMLYVAYAFLVVILLSNVLIAIVTDSYEYIQNDKAAIVFWSNRLHFMAEMDALLYGFSTKGQGPRSKKVTDLTESFRVAWTNVVEFFDPSAFGEIDFLETCVYSIFRMFSALFVIPGWVLIGLLTAGWLWPPQIREFLFVQRGVFTSRAEIERKKIEHIEQVKSEVQHIKEHMAREMLNDREDAIRIKTEIDTIQNEFLADLQQVKDLLASLTA